MSTNHIVTDAALVASVADGDAGALPELYDRRLAREPRQGLSSWATGRSRRCDGWLELQPPSMASVSLTTTSGVST